MVKDAAAVAGLLFVGVGAWLLSPPWALIIVGGVLLLGSLWGHLRGDT